jgi:F0F1-type ATP synthase delta subunit
MSKVGRTVLTKTLAAQLSDPNIAEEIAAYLIAEKRTAELDSLVRDLAQYRADNEGIVEVEVVSAHPIDSTAKTQIKAKITTLYPSAKQIIITERHDPEVLGGIRLELAN